MHCSVSDFPCWKTFCENRWSQFTSFRQMLICGVVTAGEATKASKLQALFKQRYAVRSVFMYTSSVSATPHLMRCSEGQRWNVVEHPEALFGVQLGHSVLVAAGALLQRPAAQYHALRNSMKMLMRETLGCLRALLGMQLGPAVLADTEVLLQGAAAHPQILLK